MHKLSLSLFTAVLSTHLSIRLSILSGGVLNNPKWVDSAMTQWQYILEMYFIKKIQKCLNKHNHCDFDVILLTSMFIEHQI